MKIRARAWLPARSRVLRASVVAACLSTCLATALPAAAGEVVRVGGTGSAVAAMERVGAALEVADPGVRLHVLPSLGSTGAIRAVADGALDVGVIGRPLTEVERTAGLQEREIARTPFVFAVGPRTPAAGLSPGELVAIYDGTRTAWKGGERIRPVLRPASDVDSDFLRSISPEVAQAYDGARKRPGMLLAVTNTECNQLLARSPGSIGPSSLLQIRAERLPLRALPWNGVEPTLENLAAGRYPLRKSIWLVYREPAPAGVARLVAFLASPEGRALLRELGALPGPFPAVD